MSGANLVRIEMLAGGITITILGYRFLVNVVR